MGPAMDFKRICVLALVLTVGFVNADLKLSAAQCNIAPKSRINCGYPAITLEECNKKGCCYDNSIDDVVWCFHPLLLERI
ncbi:hypothetical protein GDO86_002671, partial [Hymenochirus boettgeri]